MKRLDVESPTKLNEIMGALITEGRGSGRGSSRGSSRGLGYLKRARVREQEVVSAVILYERAHRRPDPSLSVSTKANELY